MGRKEEEALSEIQDFFLCLALGCGPGAAKHALRAHFGTRSTKLRVKTGNLTVFATRGRCGHTC